MLKKNLFLLFMLLISLFIFAGWQSNQTETSTKTNNNETEGTTDKTIEPLKVASIQFNPILNERDKNVKELLKITEEAFKNGAKLVVAPEMSTTGYYYANRKAIQPFVDTIPGRTTEKFAELAKKYDAYVVFGMPEVDKKTDLYYNSAALVGPDNEYLGGSSLYTLDPLYGLDQPIVASSDKEEAVVVTFKTLQSDWWFNQEQLLLSRRTPYFVPLTQE